MSTESSETLLSFDNVSVHYGGIQALHGISFDVKKGQIVIKPVANSNQ